MFGGTLLLGHVRPMWMEFDKTGSYALVGLVIGAGVGLLIDYIRLARRR